MASGAIGTLRCDDGLTTEADIEKGEKGDIQE
jgi:hypothetical protein